MMLILFDYLGVIVFAVTGCLVAARKGIDIIGFIWLAMMTAVGGGTVRDLILDRPVFWLAEPIYPILCGLTAVLMFIGARWIHNRTPVILWCDALGLAFFAVIGTHVSLEAGASPLVSLVLGILTATFGGVLRDLMAGEPTLVMRKEIYVTAAALSSVCFIILTALHAPAGVCMGLGCLSGFTLRAWAIWHGVTLPGYGQNRTPPE